MRSRPTPGGQHSLSSPVRAGNHRFAFRSEGWSQPQSGSLAPQLGLKGCRPLRSQFLALVKVISADGKSETCAVLLRRRKPCGPPDEPAVGIFCRSTRTPFLDEPLSVGRLPRLT